MTEQTNPGCATRSIDTLLISDAFFGYAKGIVEELEMSGRSVLWIPDRPSNRSAAKAALRIAPYLLAPLTARFIEACISQVRGMPIRDVLIIKGESWSADAIMRLRKALPMAKFVLYFWDSYRNMPEGSRRKVDVVHRAFSFDPNDVASDDRLRYRPLFYMNDYGSISGARFDIDVLFVGTVHTDRHAVLRRIRWALPDSVRCKFILYFPTRTQRLVRRMFDSSFWQGEVGDVVFEPLAKSAVQSWVSRSRALVDIERPVQAGLTMRTFEALGSGRKLITTNPRIRDSEVFSERNVCVIDRMRPFIHADFLADPFEPIDPGVISRYSLSGWLSEILPNG